jgi:hypothetical protein
MAGIVTLPSQRQGFDSAKNLLVIPTNDSATVYLVAGQDLDVSVDPPPRLVSVTAGTGDDKAAHDRGLDSWTDAQHIRKIVLKTNANKGTARLVARTSEGNDFIAPLTIHVVANKEARRVADKGEIEPALRTELQRLPLRQAVIRVAEDQLHSRVGTNAQGISLYHLPAGYGTLWCGAFADWCWDQACIAKDVPNPFGGSIEPLLSPQKAIHGGMGESTPGQLLQYAGWDPMVPFAQQKDRGPQDLRENGHGGHSVQPADIAPWRSGGATDFKHVSFVGAVDGTTFSDSNGNAYDAGTGSALAYIAGHDMLTKQADRSYTTFSLHVIL